MLAIFTAMTQLVVFLILLISSFVIYFLQLGFQNGKRTR